VKIALLGKNGQVGWELRPLLARLGDVTAAGRDDLDISQPAALRAWLRQVRPDCIVNAAAYTAVDRAESEPDLARAINASAPAVMAEEAKRCGAFLVHYSTDYVFDGTKPAAYTELDAPNPLGVYGSTKLEGEQALQSSGCRHVIFRVSWVYGTRGRNFLLTMLKLAAERPELRVVNDQVGAPTWSRTIAQTTTQYIKRGFDDGSGLFHLSASGSASWFEFAEAIIHRTRHLRKNLPGIIAIPSQEYPTPARRPMNSRLDTSRLRRLLNVALPAWEEALSECVAELTQDPRP
jgi:dTDP-4-dehydrorhamnose reductase